MHGCLKRSYILECFKNDKTDQSHVNKMKCCLEEPFRIVPISKVGYERECFFFVFFWGGGGQGLSRNASSVSFGHAEHCFLTVWTPKSLCQNLLKMTFLRR